MFQNALIKTELKIPKSIDLINHSQSLVLLGSCFSNNIGKLLNKYSFNARYNTIGTVYNPATLTKNLIQALQGNQLVEEDIIQNKDIFCHYDYHSKYNSLEKSDTLRKINQDLDTLKDLLYSCNSLFLTLGTAIVHTLHNTDRIVGNCHKFPASQFSKRMLEVHEIKDLLSTAIKELKKINPGIRIILTISPVRHTKEGISQNAMSKARLLAAVSELQSEQDIEYFPSYEIMMDDLRDYRYYKSDLIHPNKIAIQYIWKKFSLHYFDAHTTEINKKLKRIRISSKHKAFHPKSSDHQNFLKQLLKQIEDLEKAESNIELSRIKKKVSKQIIV